METTKAVFKRLKFNEIEFESYVTECCDVCILSFDEETIKFCSKCGKKVIYTNETVSSMNFTEEELNKRANKLLEEANTRGLTKFVFRSWYDLYLMEWDNGVWHGPFIIAML